jgi:glutathione S-transferase
MTEPLLNMQAAQLLQHFAPYARLNDAMMGHLLHTLATQPYMMGERFTAVDILYIELFERLRAVLGPSDLVDAYIARGDRPARQRALRRGG